MGKNETEPPFFSFIVPVYGTERFLPRCLDSLFAQTDKDFEVIVVDDCSPGDCAAVLKPYAGRVRYVRHETNRSAFQARWTGIRAATGDYVVPVDPDDYLLPDVLKRAREALASERPDVLSYWIDYDDGRRVFPHWCRHAPGAVSATQALAELADDRLFTGVASKVFRRETLMTALAEFEKVEGVADAYVNTADDYLMLVAVLMCGERMSFLDYAGYRYFVNAGSTTFTWKSAEGLRKAGSQVRFVVDALAQVAARRTLDDAARESVRMSLDGLQRFFVRNVLDGGGADLGALLAVLRETLHAGPVARELAHEVVALRASRAYRLGRALLAPLRGLKGLWYNTRHEAN